MSGEAEVKLKFVSDEKALATMEKRLETLTNRLDQMAAAGKRAGQTKVDPIAGKMAGGSTGVDPMIAKLNAHQNALREAAAHARGKAVRDEYNALPTLKSADSFWTQATTGATGYLTQMFAISKVVELIGAGVRTIADENAKWQDQLSGMDKRLEVMQARVVMQAGGTDESARDVVRTAAAGAMDVPALGDKLEDFVNAQVYLEGSSFKKEDVKSGKTLKAMNEVMAGVSAFEGGQEFASSKDAMETLSTLVDAWGKEGSVADIEHLGTVARGAFKETRMQGGDLKAFGKTAGTFAQFGVTEEEALSRFAATKEGTGSAEGTATGMKNYLLRLADITPELQAALEELNLNAADVSVEKGGTTFGESISRVKAAMGQKSEEDRNRLMAVLFGKESSTPISVMLDKEARSLDVQKEMTDREEFKEAAATFGGTELADRRRRGIRLQTAEAETVWKQGGVTFSELEEERAASTAERRLQARGPIDQVGITIDEKMQEAAESFNKGLGLGPTGGVTAKNVEQGVKAGLETLGPGGAIVELLREIAVNTIPGRERNRNGNVEPVQAP